MLNHISSWKKTRITANYPDQGRMVEEVIKPQSVIDKMVEDHRENGAVSVTVEPIEEAVIPDNKSFGRHSAFDKQQSELPPAVLDQINWVKRETDSNKKEQDKHE